MGVEKDSSDWKTCNENCLCLFLGSHDNSGSVVVAVAEAQFLLRLRRNGQREDAEAAGR